MFFDKDMEARIQAKLAESREIYEEKKRESILAQARFNANCDALERAIEDIKQWQELMRDPETTSDSPKVRAFNDATTVCVVLKKMLCVDHVRTTIMFNRHGISFIEEQSVDPKTKTPCAKKVLYISQSLVERFFPGGQIHVYGKWCPILECNPYDYKKSQENAQTAADRVVDHFGGVATMLETAKTKDWD